MTTNSNNNNNNHHASSPIAIACVSPNTGEKLPAYIVDLLNDEEAFEVEQHLVDCKLCKKRYLLMLRVRSEALVRREVAVTQDRAARQPDSVDGLEANKH